MYDLGLFIREHRIKHKLTQQELADMLHVTDGTVSKYEANTMIPPFETLRSIAGIFKVSMDELYGMKHQEMLSTHGLTEEQTKTLKELIDAYRMKNYHTTNQLTQEQFATLGQIVAELTK